MEKSLLELHQVFLDMAVLVEVQGEQLDDIESQVGRASSFVNRGTEQLTTARRHQKSTRKWTCIGIIILLIVILIIVLPIVLRNTRNGNNSSPNSNPNPTPNQTPNGNPPPGQ
ncbi:hypothetical protein IFM89_024725 [Coptis chinensis]|uniref:t-SNARE coiled-coil homology domain-containing protein n=1 Tax=Coptis chinensis TaxID=261450 RepID=A0A835H6S9_9MAGN|nr:hypothetical protein IFM89_024725 [Coptis chinensis]